MGKSHGPRIGTELSRRPFFHQNWTFRDFPTFGPDGSRLGVILLARRLRMKSLGRWTGAGSPDTMRGLYHRSSCQGTGHAIVAPSRPRVRLALPASSALSTAVPPHACCCCCSAPCSRTADAPSPPGSAPRESATPSALPTTPSGPPADAPTPWPTACRAASCSRRCAWPRAVTWSSPSTTRRPRAMAVASRVPGCITTPRPPRRGRSSFTATSG